MMLVTNVFLEIVSEVLVFQIQIENEKWKAVKGFSKISVIYDCVCQSGLNINIISNFPLSQGLDEIIILN